MADALERPAQLKRWKGWDKRKKKGKEKGRSEGGGVERGVREEEWKVGSRKKGGRRNQGGKWEEGEEHMRISCSPSVPGPQTGMGESLLFSVTPWLLSWGSGGCPDSF